MSMKATCGAAIGLIALLAWGLLWTEDTKPAEEFVILAGFETFSESFFERVMRMEPLDPKHGVLVLSDIEAFFLLSRPKDQPATPNWPPKPWPATLGNDIRLTHPSDSPTDCTVLVRPLELDGEALKLAIEAPQGSTFTLNGPVQISLDATSVVYLPSQTLIDNGKGRLYLRLSMLVVEED